MPSFRPRSNPGFNLQHAVGDGAVHTLLDVYNEINKKSPIQKTRPCITHSNFMSREVVEELAMGSCS